MRNDRIWISRQELNKELDDCITWGLSEVNNPEETRQEVEIIFSVKSDNEDDVALITTPKVNVKQEEIELKSTNYDSLETDT